MKNPYRQVKLSCGQEILVANVPDVKGLRAGNTITLKDHHDPTRVWLIESVSNVVRDRSEIKQTWHNNI